MDELSLLTFSSLFTRFPSLLAGRLFVVNLEYSNCLSGCFFTNKMVGVFSFEKNRQAWWERLFGTYRALVDRFIYVMIHFPLTYAVLNLISVLLELTHNVFLQQY